MTTLNRVTLSIDEEAEQKVEEMLAKARAKKEGKNKGRKPGSASNKDSGRNVVLDLDGMNLFNAKVCAAGIGRLTRGSITAASIKVGELEIRMVRLPKKRDFDPVRYSVQGGGKKEIAAVKTIAIQDMSERIVMEVRKNKPTDSIFQQLLTK